MRAALALTFTLALMAPVTAAACDEDDIVEGVSVRRCQEAGLVWAELRADLAATDVGVRVSRPTLEARAVSEEAASIDGALASAPAGPFTFPDLSPRGLTVGAAERWPGTRDDAHLAVLALDERGAGVIAPAEQIVPFEAWMHEALSGTEILRAGVPRDCRGAGCERGPRVAIGLSEDGRNLVIVAVEGWTERSAGVDDAALALMARDAGAHAALRTAAGAQSALWARDEPELIRPSDGEERRAPAFITVFDRESNARGALIGVVEGDAGGDARTPLPDATVKVETTDGRLVSERRPMTSGGYFQFDDLAVRDYVVRASFGGYRSSCRVCRVRRGLETWCSQFLESGSGAVECEAPPRGVDAGPWPEGDAGSPDPGPSDAGTPRDGGGGGVSGGCTVTPTRSRTGLAFGALGLLVVPWIRRRR